MLKNRIIALTAAIAAAASLFGCSLRKRNNNVNHIKEFTGVYAARIKPINENNNDIQKLIAEKTGVILHQTWIADQDDIDKTFDDMIITNKYPDFMTPDAGNCQKLLKERAFIPIDNYWDQYPSIRKLYSEAEWNRVRSDDGHIYYIPLFSAINIKDTTTIHSGEAFWIQVKVLEWAGYPEIKTLDQYFDLLERYVKANPKNENGEPYIPYEIEANDAWFFALDNPPMFLDGYPNDGCCIVDPETHEAKDYNISPTAKKWFKKLNDEYKKGIIDPECFVMSSDQYYEKIASGRVLGMVDQRWNFNGSAKALPPECTYIPLGITIDESVEGHYHDVTSFNNSAGVGISISCDDPEGAMKFLSDLLEPEIANLRMWGIEGVDYNVDENGIFYHTAEQADRWEDEEYTANHRCTYDYMPYYEGMAPDGINAYAPLYQPYEFYNTLPEPVKNCFDAYGVKTYVELLNEASENPPWYPMWSFTNTLTNDTDYGMVFKQMEEAKHQNLPLLVMSSDFESTWENYLEIYKKIDTQVLFDELTAEVRRRSG